MGLVADDMCEGDADEGSRDRSRSGLEDFIPRKKNSGAAQINNNKTNSNQNKLQASTPACTGTRSQKICLAPVLQKYREEQSYGGEPNYDDTKCYYTTLAVPWLRKGQYGADPTTVLQVVVSIKLLVRLFM